MVACFQHLALGMLMRTLHIICKLPRVLSSQTNGYSLNPKMKMKLKLFEATVTPIACFAAGHRSIRQHDLYILDVEFRRLMRSVVGASISSLLVKPVP